MSKNAKEIIKNYLDIKEEKLNFDNYIGSGAAFIVTPVNSGWVFTREILSEDHQLIESSAKEFGKNRILPVTEKLNVLNKELSLEIFKEVGELGFLGVDIPEQYGGMMLDKVTACLVVEGLCTGKNASINVTISAHSGIATLPIVWYGNEEQKQKYLPKMASGEWMGCYALTEPNAGSDAMAGEMTAKLNDDKTHYILNGQKIYITNGSWSDVCVTFAKVDGAKYTAFIVDKDCKGWSVGEEEHKMGIKGSSTTTLFFEDCMVPVENVLGKVGQGGPIAFNGLYVGRYKLGAASSAGSKGAIQDALKFANDRKQFNRPISKFGMLQKKFADMVIRSWEADSVVYMTAGSIDKSLENISCDDDKYFEILQKSIEDHAIEASISKIIGSEALWKNVDDGVQILGGAGFIEEYGFAVTYRDERINRIFEGTNEINRLIIGGYTLKKSILEELPIRNMMSRYKNDSWVNLVQIDNSDMKESCNIIEFCRTALLFTLNELILKYGQDFKNEQWVLEPFADMVISLSIMDTGFKRVKALNTDTEKYKNMLTVMNASVFNRYNEFVTNCRIVLRNLDEKDKKRLSLFNDRLNELEVRHDIIKLKQDIIDVLYVKKEYYLD